MCYWLLNIKKFSLVGIILNHIYVQGIFNIQVVVTLNSQLQTHLSVTRFLSEQAHRVPITDKKEIDGNIIDKAILSTGMCG